MSKREQLKSFLEENGCKDPDAVMKELEPFFQKADAGKYELAPADETAKERIRQAVILATGRQVDKVMFVSLTKPKWMAEDAYQNILKAILEDSLRDNFEASLIDSLWDSLRVSLRVSLEASLWDSLEASIRDNLEASLIASLWDSLGASLGASLEASLWDSLRPSRMESLFYFAGFSLVNDNEMVGKLKPLLEVLAEGYVSLGFKKDEPEVFLVFCA